MSATTQTDEQIANKNLLTIRLSGLQKLILHELQTNYEARKYANLTGNYSNLLREVALKYQTSENPLTYTVETKIKIANKFKVAFSRSLRNLEEKGCVALYTTTDEHRKKYKIKSVFLTEKGEHHKIEHWGIPKKRQKDWSVDSVEQVLISNDIGLSKESMNKAGFVLKYGSDEIKKDFKQSKLTVHRAFRLAVMELINENNELAILEARRLL